MAILHIIKAPHAVLELCAREVRDDEFGPELATHLSDMAETMYAAPGVGLAGPQVSDPRRVVVLDPGEGDSRGSRLFKMVNPEIVQRSDERITWGETCLSVPQLEVDTLRHKRVSVAWRDAATGEVCSGDFEEYEAIIVQHELDHLEGIVILDRVSGFKRRRYLKRIAKLRKREQVAVY